MIARCLYDEGVAFKTKTIWDGAVYDLLGEDCVKGGTKPNFKKYLHSKELIERLDYYLNPIIDLTEKKIKNKENGSIMFGIDVEKEDSYYEQDKISLKMD